MSLTDSEIDQLTDKIIGCGIEVHRSLGPGLLESVYGDCLKIEFKSAQLHFETERHVPLKYKGTFIRSSLLKAAECIHPIHLAQVVTYLKLTECPAGLIMNFNVTSLRKGIKRLSHPDRYRGKSLLDPMPRSNDS